MSDDRLDKLASLLTDGGKATGAKKDSRLQQTEITPRDARKATGAKKSEGTVVVSFRVPEHIERAAAQAASDLRVPYAELKKAIFYRGLLAFVRDGEEVPLHYDRSVEATPPRL
jgi:hypothetical protein